MSIHTVYELNDLRKWDKHYTVTWSIACSTKRQYFS